MKSRTSRVGTISIMTLLVTWSVQAAEPPANRENIEAALRLTRAAAAEYEIGVGEKGKPLDLRHEPVLHWSNPEQGEVHGNVFLWTREGRPLVVGALFKWFSPHTH